MSNLKLDGLSLFEHFIHYIVCSNWFFHNATSMTTNSYIVSVVSTKLILVYRFCLVLLNVWSIFVYFSNKCKGFSYTNSSLIHLSAGKRWRGSHCHVDDDSNCTLSICHLINHYQHSTWNYSLLHQEMCEVRINSKAHTSSTFI